MDDPILKIVHFGIWAAIVLFSVSASVLYFFRKLASSNWPMADATVQRGQVGRGGPGGKQAGYRSVFGYVYSVNGSRYVGLFVIVVGSEEKASELQRRLDGVHVRVRYSPSRPETSIIQGLPDEFAGHVPTQDPRWINYAGDEVIGLNL